MNPSREIQVAVLASRYRDLGLEMKEGWRGHHRRLFKDFFISRRLYLLRPSGAFSGTVRVIFIQVLVENGTNYLFVQVLVVREVQ